MLQPLQQEAVIPVAPVILFAAPVVLSPLAEADNILTPAAHLLFQIQNA
jgi:hypothetical protein